MKRRGLYTPAWRSPTDTDRKLGVVTSHELTGNESRTLLPRHDGKVVPVCVRIEDNGLCSDDAADEDETERLAATTDNHVDEDLRLDCDCLERDDVHRPTSPISSSSSMSGDDLQGYDDCNLQTSVYDLPPELTGSPSSVPPRRRSYSESSAELRPPRVERLANDALSAVVRSCRKSQDDDGDDTDRLSTVSTPAIFVVSDAKQLVIFTVDRSTSFSSPVVRVPPLSHSDHTLNR